MIVSDLLYYTLSAILVMGVLAGIALMSQVKYAIAGNILSAACVAAAVMLTMTEYDILPTWLLWASMAAGIIISLVWASRIKMIEMPQLVAVYNGFGGAASALVAILTLVNGGELSKFSLVTSGLATAVGMVTLAGSLVAAGKLARVIDGKQIILKGHSLISNTLLIIMLASVSAIGYSGMDGTLLAIVCILVSAVYGFIFSIRVGGADMPITISLLNSFSGVAGAIAGLATSDVLLVTIGGIVGASGLLLTQIMCRAMNRRISDILFGGRISSRAANTEQTQLESETALQEDASPETNLADVLKQAKTVIFIPGYGMALAQAQTFVRELSDKLEENGAEVKFAIHPVAGRMPGHMNVLLCEADVPYDKLYELESINDEFKNCDLAIIIGANDVVNAAARTRQDTPIYGMPVLNADMAKHVIICNLDLKPGYAGVDNPLFSKKAGISFMLGDAKESLANLIAMLDLKYSPASPEIARQTALTEP
jgi:H+-translocating NAD(P) transhydrogenase subunit beta